MASCCQIYRVTDESLVAKTAVWPTPFLINIFTALKGSQFYFYVYGLHRVLIFDLVPQSSVLNKSQIKLLYIFRFGAFPVFPSIYLQSPPVILDRAE